MNGRGPLFGTLGFPALGECAAAGRLAPGHRCDHAPWVLAQRVRAALEGRPEVQEAYLFGSVARGEAAPHSDVDVAVYIDRALEPQTGFGLQAELATELMGVLHRNDIDVVILNDATPLLYHRVLRDGVRLFARDLARTTTREGAAISRYCDWAPQQARMDALLRERIRNGEFGR